MVLTRFVVQSSTQVCGHRNSRELIEAVAHAFFPRLAVRCVMISHMLPVEGAEIATVSWIFDIQLLRDGKLTAGNLAIASTGVDWTRVAPGIAMVSSS